MVLRQPAQNFTMPVWANGCVHDLDFLSVEVLGLDATSFKNLDSSAIWDLGGGFKYFLFSPLLGEMIPFD